MAITDLTARRPPAPAPPAPALPSPGPAAPAGTDNPARARRWRPTTMQLLGIVGALGAILVGAIGFAMSYETLRTVAHESWGLSATAAKWFPIGVDGAIIAFLALDLYMARRGAPWPLLRTIAHGLTIATVVLNANAYGSVTGDPIQSLAHGLMPVLFVVGVEAGRRLVIHAEKMEAGTATDSIPLARWILAPIRTARLYRQMRLTAVRSYDEMVRRQRDLRGYRIWLDRKYADGKGKPTLEELLPLKLAPLGYTVAEALALPGEQDAAEVARQAEAAARAHQAHLERIDAEAETAAREAEADARRELARIETARRVAAAQRAAQDEATAAERAAALVQDLEETTEIAEANRKAADAKCAEHEANRKAADAERAEQEARRKADEARAAADRVARERAEDARKTEEANLAAALAKRETEEANLAAALAKREAAEAEAAAAEADALARLTPSARALRWIMRTIEQRAAHHIGEHAIAPQEAAAYAHLLPVTEIEQVRNVSNSAASNYRRKAVARLEAGESGADPAAQFVAGDDD